MAVKVKRAVNQLPLVGLLFFAINLVGAWLFMLIEGAQQVNYVDSVYWSFITTLSVGYGDISPVTAAGKFLAIIMASVVLLVIVPLIVGIIVSNAIEDPDKYDHNEQERAEAKDNYIIHLLGGNMEEFEKDWKNWCDKE